MMIDKIDVLDKGYVRLIGQMGGDLDVVNAARVSFQKESKLLCERDIHIIKFLAEGEHTSPFRHVFFSFEIAAPLMVARQWFKYVVGSDHTTDAWNESSRRYVTSEPTFYVPSSWRKAPDNKKQGSGAPLDKLYQLTLTNEYIRHYEESMEKYQNALDLGVCPEQARLFLPAYALYVYWRWSASLQSVAHFLNQRLADDAQVEIQEYAKAIKALVFDKAPISFGAMVK